MRQKIKQLFLVLKSLLIKCTYKIIYGRRVNISNVNSIRGKIKIELEQDASIFFGKFLMTSGPAYFKCVQNAKISIGNRCFFNHNCSVTAAFEIEIGNDCNIANNVVIVDHDHKLAETGVVDGLEAKKVTIGNNVWIGANVTILKGVHIGNGSVVAAGAVVNTNIPPFELWGGVPAQRIKLLKAGKRHDT